MKIVFLEPLGLSIERIENECEKIKELGHEIIIYPDRCPEKNIERAFDADIIVESNMPLRKDFFEACPELKMLSIAFTGLDHIDLTECEKRGIVVKNAAGYSTEAVAEEAICMMLSLYRHIIENDNITRSCSGSALAPGKEIANKTVGIIGLGAIGERTAKLAMAFGCNVIAWNRTPKTIDGVTLVDKETLLKEADIISVHVALNEETRDFITMNELRLMKPTSIIINVARGPVINAKDLSDALKSGLISGAALDVYDTEPPLNTDNPLLSAPNTIMLPHIGFATQESFESRLCIVVDNIKKFIDNNRYI